MKASKVEACKQHLSDGLTELRERLEANLAYEQGVIGLKVWILPSRYFKWYYKEADWRRLWAEFLSNILGQTFGILTLTCVGELAGQEKKPPKGSTRWTIGKGLLGEAIFAPKAPAEHLRQPFSVVNGDAWATDVATMSSRTFRRSLPRTLRRGLSQRDIERLKATYNTAVAAALRGPVSYKAFGCVTAHVPRGRSLNNEQIEACSSLLEEASTSIALSVILTMKYKPLHALIDGKSYLESQGIASQGSASQ